MGRRAPRATAAAVLPTPVGPAMTRSGEVWPTVSSLRRRRFLRLALPVSLQFAADVVHRDAADDGATVRAEVGRARAAQLGDQALHLLARQRRVGLDRAAARHE